jgi:hypothetical protein
MRPTLLTQERVAGASAEQDVERHAGMPPMKVSNRRAISEREVMSAFNPKADSRQRIEHVCLVPKADIVASRRHASKGLRFGTAGTHPGTTSPN